MAALGFRRLSMALLAIFYIVTIGFMLFGSWAVAE